MPPIVNSFINNCQAGSSCYFNGLSHPPMIYHHKKSVRDRNSGIPGPIIATRKTTMTYSSTPILNDRTIGFINPFIQAGALGIQDLQSALEQPETLCSRRFLSPLLLNLGTVVLGSSINQTLISNPLANKMKAALILAPVCAGLGGALLGGAMDLAGLMPEHQSGLSMGLFTGLNLGLSLALMGHFKVAAMSSMTDRLRHSFAIGSGIGTTLSLVQGNSLGSALIDGGFSGLGMSHGFEVGHAIRKTAFSKSITADVVSGAALIDSPLSLFEYSSRAALGFIDPERDPFSQFWAQNVGVGAGAAAIGGLHAAIRPSQPVLPQAPSFREGALLLTGIGGMHLSLGPRLVQKLELKVVMRANFELRRCDDNFEPTPVDLDPDLYIDPDDPTLIEFLTILDESTESAKPYPADAHGGRPAIPYIELSKTRIPADIRKQLLTACGHAFTVFNREGHALIVLIPNAYNEGLPSVAKTAALEHEWAEAILGPYAVKGNTHDRIASLVEFNALNKGERRDYLAWLMRVAPWRLNRLLRPFKQSPLTPALEEEVPTRDSTDSLARNLRKRAGSMRWPSDLLKCLIEIQDTNDLVLNTLRASLTEIEASIPPYLPRHALAQVQERIRAQLAAAVVPILRHTKALHYLDPIYNDPPLRAQLRRLDEKILDAVSRYHEIMANEETTPLASVEEINSELLMTADGGPITSKILLHQLGHRDALETGLASSALEIAVYHAEVSDMVAELSQTVDEFVLDRNGKFILKGDDDPRVRLFTREGKSVLRFHLKLESVIEFHHLQDLRHRIRSLLEDKGWGNSDLRRILVPNRDIQEVEVHIAHAYPRKRRKGNKEEEKPESMIVKKEISLTFRVDLLRDAQRTLIPDNVWDDITAQIRHSDRAYIWNTLMKQAKTDPRIIPFLKNTEIPFELCLSAQGRDIAERLFTDWKNPHAASRHDPDSPKV